MNNMHIVKRDNSKFAIFAFYKEASSLLPNLVLFLNNICILQQLKMFLVTYSTQSQFVRILNQGMKGLVLPYVGSISLQSRTKLKKSLKNILNGCKMQLVFNKTRLGNIFHFKDLTSGVVYNFQCDLSMCNKSCYGECIRHLNSRIGEHIGLAPLTKKQESTDSSIANYLLFATIQHSMTILVF